MPKRIRRIRHIYICMYILYIYIPYISSLLCKDLGHDGIRFQLLIFGGVDIAVRGTKETHLYYRTLPTYVQPPSRHRNSIFQNPLKNAENWLFGSRGWYILCGAPMRAKQKRIDSQFLLVPLLLGIVQKLRPKNKDMFNPNWFVTWDPMFIPITVFSITSTVGSKFLTATNGLQEVLECEFRGNLGGPYLIFGNGSPRNMSQIPRKIPRHDSFE